VEFGIRILGFSESRVNVSGGSLRVKRSHGTSTFATRRQEFQASSITALSFSSWTCSERASPRAAWRRKSRTLSRTSSYSAAELSCWPVL